MVKRISFGLAMLCAIALMPCAALAQQQPDAYTAVAAWGVPFEQWGKWVENWEKNVRPVLDRHAADGTLIGWGAFETVVHELDGLTHGIWLEANSIAAIQKVRDELVKLPPTPGLSPTKHRDYLFRSILYQARSSRPGGGYLWVSSGVVKPGKGQEWRALWEKYTKGLYDELLANGTISYYAVDVEHVHTEDPGLRQTVYITPTADGVDKVRAAGVARSAKRSAEENRAIGDSFAEVTVAGAHRDYFARVLSCWHK